MAPLLARYFTPAEDSTVTVSLQQSAGVDYLAGNDYRLSMVALAAKFDGREHHIEGKYVLVMFEDASIPTILGRERLGIPRLYADISPLRLLEDDHIRCEASPWGHLLMGFDLTPPLRRKGRMIRKAASKLSSEQAIMAYKHIPATWFDDPPDADYPTVIYNDYDLNELWIGE